MTARPRLARIAAALLSVVWGFFFFGLTDLIAFTDGPEYRAAMMLSTGWGLLFLVLVAAPLVAVAVAPRVVAPLAVCQVAACSVAVAVAAAVSASPRHLAVAAALAVSALIVLALSGGLDPVRRLGWRATPGPAVLVLVAVAPLCAYAWMAARSAGSSPTTSYTAGLDHWPIQAALPFAVLLAAALAAGRPRGWRVPAWSAGAAVLWFAVVSWLEPHLTASPGRRWAVAATLWAIAFVVSAERGHRAPVPGGVT